ncbi:MAG: hypothetical protein ABR575_11835 [Actinomycetota bacterium]
MRACHRAAGVIVLAVVAAGALVPLAPPAGAAATEPAIYAHAWYWENQQNETVETPAGPVLVEVPNPFCPQAPGALGGADDVCARARLPVEVIRGDYETPDKLSAVTFDLSTVPPGSTVTDFTVTFLEAESGCYGSADASSGQRCEQTDARDAAGHVLQACLVTEQFGEGDARPYKELPKFTCSDSDPVATRKEIKNDAKTDPEDTDPDHQWTFNLTAFGQEWLETGTFDTSILIHPRPGKDGEPDEPADSWRVVLAGPRFPKGIAANLEFAPPPDDFVPPPGGGTSGGSTGSVGGFSSGGTTGATSFGGATGGTGGSAVGGTTPTGVAPSPGAPETSPVAGAAPEVQAMPGYVWLAILAGVMAFSLVRRFVLDPAMGHRPDGVLAQIHRLNAERRGSPKAPSGAAEDGPLAALRTGVATLARSLQPLATRATELARKVPFPRRR